MRKSIKITIAIAVAVTMCVCIGMSAIAALPDEQATGNIPVKKTQIDWLISGAGGCVVTAGGPAENQINAFHYEFTSQDGSVRGAAQGNGSQVRIFSQGADGLYTEVTSGAAFDLARVFTQHFPNLTRVGHFHATHTLSERGTEEYPIALGSSTFMTFFYRSVDNGGMMSGMLLQGTVKFVTNLQPRVINLPMSTPNNPDPNNPNQPVDPNNPADHNAAPNNDPANNQLAAGGNTQNNTARGTAPLNTGIESVVIFGGIAVLAIGAILLSMKNIGKKKRG
jgi:hypothetical protein